MSCHEESWPLTCPRHHDADGSPLIPCELRAHIHDARCVAITGTMLHESERLVMAQHPGAFWTARLLLKPDRYIIRLHVVKAQPDTAGSTERHASWEIEFDVPDLQRDTRHAAELRLWLHEPIAADPIEFDHTHD